MLVMLSLLYGELTFINGTEHAVRAGGPRAPVTGWDSMCKKAQLSDLQTQDTLEDQRAELSNATCVGVYRSANEVQS